ncbi:MAG: DUF1292 domain-containing protein [Oscillospiraceae bacterium]|nr:DUF1292 domain-containing protein [Oscillospiraceae bacterium]
MNNNEKAALNTDEEAVEIVDLDGEPFVIIGELEHEGEVYLALISHEDYEKEDENEEDDIEFVILKEVEEEDGELALETVDDDELYEELGNGFLELFAGSPEDE